MACIEALRTDTRDDRDVLLAGWLLSELERAHQFPASTRDPRTDQ